MSRGQGYNHNSGRGNYNRGSKGYEDYEDNYERDRRGNHGRGFASMPREEVHRIAAMGGHASHSGHGRNYSGSNQYDEGRDYDRDYENYGAGRDGGRGNGGRGFASMPREDVRRMAAMGGHALHGGYGNQGHYGQYEGNWENDRDYGYDEDDYNDRGGYEREYSSQPYNQSGYSDYREGRGDDWEDEDDYDYRQSTNSSYEEGYGDEGYDSGYQRESGNRGKSGRQGLNARSHSGRGRQGFASMPKDQVRRIAAMGGRASHGGHGGNSAGIKGRTSSTSRVSNSSRGTSRVSGRSGGKRGFAAMDKDEVRRIAAMGGKASHGGHSGSKSLGSVSRSRSTTSGRSKSRNK